MKKILIAAVLLAAATAQARLGWTLEQCRQHFGPEIKAPEQANDGVSLLHYFKADGLQIILSTLNNRGDVVDFISYEKEKGDLTDEEINTLLEKNAGPTPWVLSPPPKGWDFSGNHYLVQGPGADRHFGNVSIQ